MKLTGIGRTRCLWWVSMATFVILYCLTVVVMMISFNEREWPAFFGCAVLGIVASSLVGKLVKDRKKWKRSS